MKISLKIVFLLFAVTACAPGQQSSAPGRFPDVTVPTVLSNPDDIKEYYIMHFWDAAAGHTVAELEPHLADFIGFLDAVPLPQAKAAVSRMFDNIVKADAADTSAHFYKLMTEQVSRYLYDPNSPLRNEDYYQPFAAALAESPLTADDMRNAFRYEAECCAKNPCGSEAPDFRVRTIKGTSFRLKDIQAEYIMLFFSNPGCTACKEIIDEVQSSEILARMIEEEALAVVNVYIDEDLNAWREYEHNYPSSWHTGYDPDGIIRGDELYSVRAIPSLYLLGAGRRIIMKDAPTPKVISYLEKTR